MEILSPAGSKETLKAAIKGGADAVYMGGKMFGARRSAANFSDSELKAAVELAHNSGIKTYITVNTLIKESELSSVLSFIDLLVSIRADAVIVQDRGLLELLLEKTSIDVHASTQMGIQSPDDAKWAEGLGIKRSILPRELNLRQIEDVRKATKMEIEVFVHGALCYCFSGQCLFSSILGGRSGNRGMCAQPCRKKYVLAGEENFALSTADLFSIEAIPRLLEMGVDAIKIEGRLRSPAYVYVATKVYSNAVNRAERGEKEIITPRERELLEVVFNRGSSGGYMLTDMVMQREYSDSRGLPLGRATVQGRSVSIPTQVLKEGDGITFYRGAEKIGGFEVKGIIYEGGGAVLTSPFRLEMGEYAAYKTKDRDLPKIEKDIASISFPERRAERSKMHLDLPNVERGKVKAELSYYISDLRALRSVLPSAARIYYEMSSDWEEARSECDKVGKEFVLLLPRAVPSIPDNDASALMISSPGGSERFKERRLYGSYFMNFFNSRTIPELYQYTMSVELSRDDIRNVIGHYGNRLEIMAFGRIELMVTKDPTLKEGTLIDDRGKRFPVVRDPLGYAHILNSSDLFLLDFIYEMEDMGIESLGIDLRGRRQDLCELVSKAFSERDIGLKDKIKRKCGSITSGHYLRGVM